MLHKFKMLERRERFAFLLLSPKASDEVVHQLARRSHYDLKAYLNASAHPKGRKRKKPPTLSIWPKGKVATPARMG